MIGNSKTRDKECKCGCGALIMRKSTWSVNYVKRKKKVNHYEELTDGSIKIFMRINGEQTYCLIDKDDLERILLKSETWWVVDNTSENHPYARTSSFKGEKGIRMHRVIMNAKKGELVDHINHNTLDNRKCNLRIVSRSENGMNRKGITVKNKTGVRNVYFRKNTKKYSVQIRKNNILYDFGYYSNLEEASKVAELERIKLFGDFSGGSS